MIYVSGQPCPKPCCRGTLLAHEDQFGHRLVCTLCGYEEDPYSAVPFRRGYGWGNGKDPRTRSEPPNYQPSRQRERDAWQKEIGD